MGTWSASTLISAISSYSRPALVMFNNQLYCFYLNDLLKLAYTIYQGGTSWSTGITVPNFTGGCSKSPGLAVYNNFLYCVCEGAGDSGWTWSSTLDGSGTWSSQALIPDSGNAYGVSGSPALSEFNLTLYCVREGQGDSGWTWCGILDGTWGSDSLIPNSGSAFGVSGSPALANYNSKLFCVRRGRQNSTQLWFSKLYGGIWDTDTVISGITATSDPSLVVFNNVLYCFFTNNYNLYYVTYNTATNDWSAGSKVSVPGAKSAVLADGIAVCSNPVTNTLFLLYRRLSSVTLSMMTMS